MGIMRVTRIMRITKGESPRIMRLHGDYEGYKDYEDYKRGIPKNYEDYKDYIGKNCSSHDIFLISFFLTLFFQCNDYTLCTNFSIILSMVRITEGYPKDYKMIPVNNNPWGIPL